VHGGGSTLDGVSRVYNTARILDEQVPLTDYTGPIRQMPSWTWG